MKKLLIVIPCYKEEEVLPSTISTMSSLLKNMIKDKLVAQESRIHFVDDGSTDNTWNILQKACEKEPLLEASKLSRNFGQIGAMLAGMYDNDADLYCTIDSDLQDDPNCIIEMVKKINEGNDIVYGVRKKRDTDTWFKRFTAQAFYKLMSLLGVNMVHNHSTFRMMSKRTIEYLKKFPERNLFLPAIVPLVGFKSDMVYYDRTARLAGETKYSICKLFALAWNGISSFSIVPLRLVTFMGFLITFMGACFVLKIFMNYNAHGAVSGWASTVTLITVFSGVQLVSIGIIGEYIAKIFVEVKQRPHYIIEEKVKNKNAL